MRLALAGLCLALWACSSTAGVDARVPRVVDGPPPDRAAPADARPDATDGASDATPRLDAALTDATPATDATPRLDAARTDATPAQDAAQPQAARFLALGDSYTIGESVPAEGRWPVQLSARLAQAGLPVEPPRIIARTGWSVAQLMAAVAAEDPAGPHGLVTLLIGVNDQFRGGSVQAYEPAFAGALAEAIRRAGGRACRVVVLAIPDYGFTPFGRGDQARISAALDAFNAVNRAQTLAAGAHYVDIVAISRRGLAEPALVAPDGLHPSAAQYAEWAAAAQPAATDALTNCP